MPDISPSAAWQWIRAISGRQRPAASALTTPADIWQSLGPDSCRDVVNPEEHDEPGGAEGEGRDCRHIRPESILAGSPEHDRDQQAGNREPDGHAQLGQHKQVITRFGDERGSEQTQRQRPMAVLAGPPRLAREPEDGSSDRRTQPIRQRGKPT